MNYKTIYLFEIINKVKEGNQVYVLDRKIRIIHNANCMALKDLTVILSNEEKNRYEAWVEEIEESVNKDEQ